MSEYDYVITKENPQLGGNIWQGDPWTFAPKVWKFMIERFAIRSVLDVGSGKGYAAKWFHDNGCQTVAMDGEPLNSYHGYFPTVIHDIADGGFRCPVDLVHCQEVVEHIKPEYINNLMHTITNGRVVLMTHGEPGQAGHHHVNLQPPEYWIGRMKDRGFNLLTHDTATVRNIAQQESAHHLARSGLVFARKLII